MGSFVVMSCSAKAIDPRSMKSGARSKLRDHLLDGSNRNFSDGIFQRGEQCQGLSSPTRCMCSACCSATPQTWKLCQREFNLFCWGSILLSPLRVSQQLRLTDFEKLSAPCFQGTTALLRRTSWRRSVSATRDIRNVTSSSRTHDLTQLRKTSYLAGVVRLVSSCSFSFVCRASCKEC